MQDRYEVGAVNSTSTDFTVWNGYTSRPPTTRASPSALTTPPTAVSETTSGVADNSFVDLILGGIPMMITGCYPCWSNSTAVDAHHWTWFILKAHKYNNRGTASLTSSDPRDVPRLTSGATPSAVMKI
jgi:hypothetical protein